MMKKKRLFGGETSWALTQPVHEQVTAHLSSLASRALPQKLLEDRVGLSRAYAAPESVYVRGTSMFISGTQISRWRTGEAFRDMYDDLKIPLMATNQTHRYAQVKQALAAHPEVTHLISHSLGGSVALEIAKERPELQTTTYGAPVMDVFARSSLQSVPNRYASYGDPVAMFDTNATPGVNLGNPHSFDNFANTSSTDSRPGYENADGTVTLFE
jgi:pimeloyl-ACP methyl ester carboxylesterase